MKYTKSKDGVKRTSIKVVVRLEQDEVAAIRSGLRKLGEPADDAGVREYVRSVTEYDPGPQFVPGGESTSDDEYAEGKES